MSPVLAALEGALNLDLPKQNRSFGRLPAYLSDAFLIIGVGLGLLVILALGVYLWMKLAKKRRRHISEGEKVFRDSAAAAEAEESNDEPDDSEQGQSHHHGGRRRYKYRVRRRTHRSRNPTLSETGGLPPVKTQQPSKPC